MTGLEKIISQIEQEAKDASAEILAKADKECAGILADAKATCGEITAKSVADCAALRADLLARAESGAQMQRKNRILAAKQEIIRDVIEKAMDKLLHQQNIDYFVLLGKMAERNARSGNGVMYLSGEDLARLPAYFPRKLNEIGEAKGGTLVLSEEPREIKGGFILAYGGIEENCSFEALFEAEKERLQDIVRAQLFS